MKTAQKIYKQDLKEHRKKFWGKKWGLGVGRKVSPLFAVERVKRLIPGGKEPAYQCRGQKRGRFGPWVGRIPQRKKWQTTPGFLPGKSHGQRSVVGYSSKGRQGSDTTAVT